MSGDEDIRSLIKKEPRFVTTDDAAFPTEKEAFDHQEVLSFTEWCDKNICHGGEWSSDMVARAILQDWMVRPR